MEEAPKSEKKKLASEEARSFEGNAWPPLPNDIESIDKGESALRERLHKDTSLNEDDVDTICLAFREVLINAIVHGNLGLQGENVSTERILEERKELRESDQPEKYVTVRLEVTKEVIRIIVKDEGAGFDWRNLPDPADSENILKTAGRGIFLAHTYFDSVDFNEKGNEVTMIKNLHPESGEKT